ncbi:hypothetical protein DH2020_011874 [Rehmannia glutinosa]|uniref:Acyl-[acyl-carrier-protein] hydrolase n=1 Tax=Rehmannia glutinosa TaxID=99300 RepID=A0ABR0XER0_REHGL
MASISHHMTFFIRSTSNRNGQEPNKQKLHSVKINGTKSNVDLLSQDHHHQAITITSTENHVHVFEQQIRQNIPTKKQLVDSYRQGIIIEEGVGYRQTVVIRSYEVGPDKTATIESILNLLQETALNHVWMSGLLGDGFGATHGMMRNNLIWVVSRMQVQVDHYPICTWVMMNQQTRRLSKMPDEVRGEISPWFIEKQAIEDEGPEKIDKLDNNARYVNSDLKPKRSDLDMNHHVNNVKYVRWMLETIPDEFLENHQLSDIILEYRRECGSSDVVQSLCQPQEHGLLKKTGIQQCNNHIGLNGNSLSSEIFEVNGLLGSLNQGPYSFTHLLQIKGEHKNEEIVRGKTKWNKKLSAIPFHS